jgi:hypothetical protein
MQGQPVVSRGVLTTRYLAATAEKGAAMRGQPSLHWYFERPLGILLQPFFDAGLALDAILEPSFAGPVGDRSDVGAFGLDRDSTHSCRPASTLGSDYLIRRNGMLVTTSARTLAAHLLAARVKPNLHHYLGRCRASRLTLQPQSSPSLGRHRAATMARGCGFWAACRRVRSAAGSSDVTGWANAEVVQQIRTMAAAPAGDE